MSRADPLTVAIKGSLLFASNGSLKSAQENSLMYVENKSVADVVSPVYVTSFKSEIVVGTGFNSSVPAHDPEVGFVPNTRAKVYRSFSR